MASLGSLPIQNTPFGINAPGDYALDPDMVSACYRYLYAAQGSLYSSIDIGKIASLSPEKIEKGKNFWSWKDFCKGIAQAIASFYAAKSTSLLAGRDALFNGTLNYQTAGVLNATALSAASAIMAQLANPGLRDLVNEQLELECDVFGLDAHTFRGVLAFYTHSIMPNGQHEPGAVRKILDFWGTGSMLPPTTFGKLRVVKSGYNTMYSRGSGGSKRGRRASRRRTSRRYKGGSIPGDLGKE